MGRTCVFPISFLERHSTETHIKFLVFDLNNIIFTLLVEITQAEVNNFHSPIIIDEYIFGFEIPMGYSYAMKVLDSINNLMEYFAGFVFW